MINYRAAFAIAGLAVLASTGCRGTVGLAPVGTAARLTAEHSVELDGSAVAVCGDGDRLLVLETSGTRIVRLDAELIPVDTVPLTERLVGPRGIAADRFYIYVYDGHVLSRILKEDPVLKPWLNNVRVAGLAVYTPGEMLVSDAERGVIECRDCRSAAEAGRRVRPACDRACRCGVPRSPPPAGYPGGRKRIRPRTPAARRCDADVICGSRRPAGGP